MEFLLRIRLWILLFMFGIHTQLSKCHKFTVANCLVYYEEPCQSENVLFYLHTTNSTNAKKELHILDPFKPILPFSFNRSTPTKVIIHGYGGLSLDFAMRNVTNAYNTLGYNIIAVDWSLLSALPCYPASYLNTWHVGQCTAILAASLTGLGITPDQLHVLGFSLGAHVASFASNYLHKTLGIKFGRITGLDPALPLFATLHNEWKLDKDDAYFVDIIHTSAGSFGKLEAAGHVDFYVNGGTVQPACANAPYPPLCSHIIAGLYYAETIMNKQHYGIECQSIIHYNFGFCQSPTARQVIMGEYINHQARGIFFVNINIDQSNAYYINIKYK